MIYYLLKFLLAFSPSFIWCKIYIVDSIFLQYIWEVLSNKYINELNMRYSIKVSCSGGTAIFILFSKIQKDLKRISIEEGWREPTLVMEFTHPSNSVSCLTLRRKKTFGDLFVNWKLFHFYILGSCIFFIREVQFQGWLSLI